MKNTILLAIFITGGSFWYKKSACEPVAINFAGKEWLFPSTVEDAVKKHTMDYKPPGYYYKVDSLGMKAILDYHSRPLDFENEYQAREVLFPRKLHSCIFSFPEKTGTYDSLKTSLEQTFKSKFVLTKGLKDEKYAKYLTDKTFQYNFLTVNPCMTIGIKRSVPESRNKTVTVRFMYDLSLGEMGVYMGSF